MNLNNLVDSCSPSEVGEFSLIESMKILKESRDGFCFLQREKMFSFYLPSLSTFLLPLFLSSQPLGW